MNKDIYIQFLSKKADDLSMRDLKFSIWYNANPDVGKSSMRQRVVRAVREYHTITTNKNQDISIRLNSGMKDCVAIVIMIKEPIEVEFKPLDNIGDVTLHINENNITRTFNEMSSYNQDEKIFGLIRLTIGYDDFEKVLRTNHSNGSNLYRGAREIPSENSNSMSFNTKTLITSWKQLEITVIYFGYNIVCFKKDRGIYIKN